jgi:hypothetical protein
MEKKSVEEIWESFWKPIVTTPDGQINLDQLKKELADFSFVMDEVPKVYCHITGSRMSYITYYAEDVIRVADDYAQECYREDRESERKDWEAQQPQGPRWVKASEFKHEVGMPYHAKDGTSKGAGHFDQSGNFIWGDRSTTLLRDQGDLSILIEPDDTET